MLHVLDPGLYSLVVDFGRPHCRSLGIPVGGASDRTSLMLGNALVGNAPDAAALEFSLNGPLLEAECELACVVFGAPFELKSKRQKLRAGVTFKLAPGERLEIGGTHIQMRGYLCATGGFLERTILGSRSSLEPLEKGALLKCRPGRIKRRFAGSNSGPVCTFGELSSFTHSELQSFTLPARREKLRVLDGAQASWFPIDMFHGEHSPSFKVSQSSDRMGIRLQGTPLPFPDRELLSEPVCPGTVQVTRDGQCIILGVDGQTIGGYPKIAQVISADLDNLGQLRPGDEIAFQRVSLDEAEELYREKQSVLRAWVMRMRVSGNLAEGQYSP